MTAHVSKIEAAKILKLLAERLHTAADVIVGYYWPAVGKALEAAMRDRVLKVQNAAGEAYKEWQRLQATYLEMEKKKTQPENRPKTAAAAAVSSVVNKYKEARNLAKQQKLVSSPSLASNAAKFEEISAIWGSAARAAKYLRKRDGSGGGNVVQGAIVRKSRSKGDDPTVAALNNDKIMRELEKNEQPILEDVKNEETKVEDHKIRTGMTAKEFILSKKKELEQREQLQKMRSREPEEVVKRETVKNEEQDSLEDEIPPPPAAAPEEVVPDQPPLESSPPGIDRQSDDPDIDKESEASARADNLRAPPNLLPIRKPAADQCKTYIHPPQGVVTAIIQKSPAAVVAAAAAITKARNEDDDPLRDTVDFTSVRKYGAVPVTAPIAPVQQAIPATTAQWLEAARKLSGGNVEEGYRTVLAAEDDLYLLRIMLQTGPVSQKLSVSVTENVLRRTNQIVRENAIPKVLLKWIQQAVDRGDFYEFSTKVQNELLDTLYELGETKTELGESAADLYRKIVVNSRHNHHY